MPNLCILSDNLLQYPAIRFPGQNRIRIVNISLSINNVAFDESQDFRIQDLPETVDFSTAPHLLPPGEEQLRKLFTTLLEQFDEVIAIFSAAAITKTFENARKAATKVDKQSRIQIIDSQTISLGLGYLVKYAAELADRGLSAKELVQHVYAKIPHIYTLFNIPSLSYLFHNGLLDISQAYVGEKLGLMANFSIEDGIFVSTDKMRNKRHVTDYFLEYLKEFESLDYVAFVYGYTTYSATAKLLREFVKEAYENTDFSEHKISLPVALLFGASCQGLMIVDNEN